MRKIFYTVSINEAPGLLIAAIFQLVKMPEVVLLFIFW